MYGMSIVLSLLVTADENYTHCILIPLITNIYFLFCVCQHEVTTRTSEFVTRTSEKTVHTGEEVIKQLSEMKMTTAVIEDPSLLKQKVLDSSLTTTTTTTNADGEVTTTTTTTTNGTE